MIEAILAVIGAVLAAIVSFLLYRFFGERPKPGEPGRSPRVSAAPHPPFEYVARPEKEDEVAQLLLGDKPVCITGGPGIGKSCLAMAVVHKQHVKSRFSDGIWWLDAAAMNLAAMCEAVGSALEKPEIARAKSDDEKLGALRTAIAGKNILVVLDNCENPAASHRFAEAHRATLVTSQHRPTGPEPVTLEPLTDEQCLQVLQRTAGRALEPDEEPVVLEIVTVLEGLPFAVALAGSQLQDAAAQQVLQDLKRLPWPVLTDKGRKDRAMKRSLDAAYKRLSADQRRLFAALGVFGGPTFDLAAVRAVEPSADAVHMDGLVRRSLVRRDDGRYALHPLVRRYARDRLGRRREPYQKMADHYLALAGALGDDPSTFDRLEPDVGNALAAMDWCLGARQWQSAARFAIGVGDYLRSRGLWGERRERFSQARRAARRSRNAWLQSACCHNLATAAQDQGDYQQARHLYEESLAIAEGEADRWGIGAAKHQLGRLARQQRNYDEARLLLGESVAIFDALGDRQHTAGSKHELAILAQSRSDHAEAGRLYQESLAIKEGLGDRPGIAKSKHQLGMLAQIAGDYKEARRLYEESLAIAEELGDRPGIASTKHQLGRLAEEEGDRAAARELYQEALAMFESLGSPDAEIARRSLERVSAPPRKRRKKKQ
ncbi:MAG: tetratricopeptide repeat protein [Dehalococcoidia bacterium]